jgi:drug/metabolite transporter (DMT)-like permease
MSKYFIFIIITVMLNAASQILMKSGMSQVGQAEMSASRIGGLLLAAATNPLIILGLAISMGTHLMSLSRFDVSFAFPFLSVAYLIVAAYGHYFMGEAVSPTRILGIGTIMLGTVILARS